MSDSPYLSVIIPVKNGGLAFQRCLAALKSSTTSDYELIVVDDGSSDDSASVASALATRLLTTALTDHQSPVAAHQLPDANPQSPTLHPASFSLQASSGPAVARNLGARAARGEVLFFVDADIAVRPDTVERVVRAFAADADLVAAFGSYDEHPADPGFLSQYKNLFHHYIHQHARTAASTFWAGCGAMRRAAFLAVFGFDEVNYRWPSIEDIELGYRLSRRGAKIRLFKDWQVTHLKRWTFGHLLRSDIFNRGVPWTRLLWRETLRSATDRGARPFLKDLNLQTSNRVSVVCVYLLAATLLGAALHVLSLAASVLLAVALLWLNRDLYIFFARRRGWAFAVQAVFFHWLYYLYNGVSFALGTLAYLRDGAPRVASDGSWAADKG